MKRISLIILAVLALALLVFAHRRTPKVKTETPTVPPQTGISTSQTHVQKLLPTARRIQVNAQTIAALPKGRNYEMDLTQPNVIYDFDRKAGPIDFTRVEVRTNKGKEAFDAFEKRILTADQLGAWASQTFSIGVPPTAPPTGTLATRSQGASYSCRNCGKAGQCCCNVDLPGDCEKMTSEKCRFVWCRVTTQAGQIRCYCWEGL